MYHPFSVAETTKSAWTIFQEELCNHNCLLNGGIPFAVDFCLAVYNEIICDPEEFGYKMITLINVMVFVHSYTTLGLIQTDIYR
jgi:hypothetical protein